MRALRSLLRILAVILLFVAIFGSILDVGGLLNLPMSGNIAIIVALVLLALERHIASVKLTWQLESRQDLQQRIDKLAEFRKQAITTLYAGTPGAAEFDAWKASFHRWEDALVEYLKHDFPYAVFEMFEDQGLIPPTEFQHLSPDLSIRTAHLDYLRRIAKHLTVLERVIQQNTGVTKPREPSLTDLLRE